MIQSKRYIINHVVSNDIRTIIVGHNKNWKQEVNIGKVNNQIPFDKLIHQLKYKGKEGINVIEIEESYTSKCSFIDNESIEKHEEYLGQRIKRGLFKSKNGSLINSDINGSYNIMRKYLKCNCDAVMPADVGFVYNPIKVYPLIKFILFMVYRKK